MLNSVKALRVSIYLTEGATHHGTPVWSNVLDYLLHEKIRGAMVLKGVAGFGADHQLHSESSVEISDRLPMKVEFIESPERAEQLLPKLRELAGAAVIEVQETSLLAS